MERSHIAILESFPLISVIIPYYGFTHWGFLLLSALSRKTRSILMENYKVFRRIMLQYSKERKIEDNGEWSLLVLLPADLFRFNIRISAEKLIELARTVVLLIKLFILFFIVILRTKKVDTLKSTTWATKSA